MDLPWVMSGNFNKILSLDDKLGGSKRRNGGIIDFQACLDGCELQDLWWRSYHSTWCNNQEGEKGIEERLDRYCANYLWLYLFNY